jgi:hypothetical protein
VRSRRSGWRRGRFGFGGAEFGGDEFVEIAEFEGLVADVDGFEVGRRSEIESWGTDLGFEGTVYC